jgi:hypothetical protein
MSNESKQTLEQQRPAAVRSSDLLAVTKLKCRNGDNLDALEDTMVELIQLHAKYCGELKAAEAKIQPLRDAAESLRSRMHNVECRMSIWHAEHGEKLKALTAND